MTKLMRFNKSTFREPLKSVFGIDPAHGCTGWSLLIVDGDQSLHVVESGVIKPPNKYEQNQQFSYIYGEMFNVFNTMINYLTLNGIELVGYSIEIPAVLLGGVQRISRDIVQIQAIGAIRAALGDSGYKEAIIRPNQVHACAGANSIKFFKQLKQELKDKGYKKEKIQTEIKKIKKQMVKDWVVKNCILYNNMKSFDESDAIIISVVGYHLLTNTKKGITKC